MTDDVYLDSDGTLGISANVDITKVKRILLTQEGTHYGSMYYLDDSYHSVTCDCISRQGTIDALTEYGSGNNIYMSVGELKRRIETLPSAQPDRSLWFRIGETCVNESKGIVSAKEAIKKIRELLRIRTVLMPC